MGSGGLVVVRKDSCVSMIVLSVLGLGRSRLGSSMRFDVHI